MKASKLMFAAATIAIAIALFTTINAVAQQDAPDQERIDMFNGKMQNGTFVGRNYSLPAFAQDSTECFICATTMQVREYSTGGQAAAFIAVIGGNIWVTNSNSSSVTKMSPNGVILGIFQVGSVPDGIIGANGNVYVANWGDGTVSELAQTGATVKTIGLPSGAHPYQLAFDGKSSIWTSDENGYVDQINVKTGQVVCTIRTGWYPYQLISAGTSIVVTLLNNEFAKINPTTGAVTLFAVPNTSSLTGVTFDGSHYFFLDFSGLLTKTDTMGNVLGTVQTGLSLAQVVYYDSPSGALYATGLGTNAVVKVNPKTLAMQNVPLPASSLDQPLGIGSISNLMVVADNGPENLGVTVFPKN